ncbi:hypothetical protein AgCh_036610 [Apium graveolens]
MGETKTVARFARWTFEALSTRCPKQSEPFQMSLWTWYVAVEKDQTMHTKAEAANDQLTKELVVRKELVNTLFMKHQSEK